MRMTANWYSLHDAFEPIDSLANLVGMIEGEIEEKNDGSRCIVYLPLLLDESALQQCLLIDHYLGASIDVLSSGDFVNDIEANGERYDRHRHDSKILLIVADGTTDHMPTQSEIYRYAIDILTSDEFLLSREFTIDQLSWYVGLTVVDANMFIDNNP